MAGLVLDRIHALISSEQEIAEALDPLDLTAKQLDLALRRAAELDRQWLTIPPDDMRALARQMIARVTLSAALIEVAVARPATRPSSMAQAETRTKFRSPPKWP